MAEKNNNVRFIRVRGRIIPIRTKPGEGRARTGRVKNKVVREPGNRAIAKGFGFGAAAGAFAGALGILGVERGNKAGKLLDKARRGTNVKTSRRQIAKGFKTVQSSKRFLRAGQGVRLLGVAGAGTLIGQGLSENAKAEGGSLKEFSLTTVGALGAVATDVAIRKVFKTKRGSKALEKIMKRARGR